MMKSKYLSGFVTLLMPVLLTGSYTYADPYPHYDEDSGELTIPAIDADDQTAGFQDAILTLVNDNVWQLTDVYEAKLNNSIAQVELIRTDTTPVQILLRISGVYTHGCARTGQTHTRLDGNTIDVSSFYENNLWVKSPEIVLCTANVTNFSFVHPLPVYGLQAGTYSYQVNDEFSGTFTLDSHNVFTP